MKRETLFQIIGFGLVALGYLASALFVFQRKTVSMEKEGQITLRIAHWQLEQGLRHAFDELAVEFNRQHPEIRVEQLLVPERIFPNWLVTQLIGGTAPDLIEVGYGLDDERLARYFLPLSLWVERPNPYNAGTALEKLSWRDTFLDGMYSSYNPTLQDYYSAGLNMHTVRLYYNRGLYEKIMGVGAPAPTKFRELELVFEKLADYNRGRLNKVVAIAGSDYNGPLLLDQFLSNQTQKLLLRLNDLLDFSVSKPDTQLAYLQGRWNFESPEVRSGLDLQHEVGRNLPSGFQSLRREDATFYFLQQRALMIVSGSWDVRTLKAQAPFPIDIVSIPLPTPENPEYGKYVLGAFAENNDVATRFGITRLSKHPKAALAFLQFMTSQRGNQLFVDTSYWLPSVIGVTIPEPIRAFQPIVEGYTQGLAFNSFGADGRLVINQNLYRLYGDHKPVESFTQSLEDELRPAVRRDLLQEIKTRKHAIAHDDTTLAALLWKRQRGQASSETVRKIAATRLNQDLMECGAYTLETSLDSIPR